MQFYQNIADIFYFQIDVHYYCTELFLKYMYIEFKNSIIEYFWHHRNFWNFFGKKGSHVKDRKNTLGWRR